VEPAGAEGGREEEKSCVSDGPLFPHSYKKALRESLLPFTPCRASKTARLSPRLAQATREAVTTTMTAVLPLLSGRGRRDRGRRDNGFAVERTA
jgi:hypothetical protein